jgi:molybdenum cofactor cytidylyltransferase
MKAQTVDVKSSTGRVLCCTVFRPGGKKLLAKGHIISEEDIRVLESEGMENIWVTELEEGEVGEDDAVCQVASEMGCGSFEIRLAAGGRANLLATENCCVLVDDELLKQINCTASVVIATALNFSYAVAGQRIATVKSAPFAVAKDQLEAVIGILKERGPILQARPVRTPERFGVNANFVLACTEDEHSVTRCMQHLLRSKPCVIMVASTTAPAGPEDVIGQAMSKIGCQVERFLAPVEPGNLLLLSYRDDVPIISAPGCFRSAKPNVVDLILPPLLARYHVTGWEVACLGHGGLLA